MKSSSFQFSIMLILSLKFAVRLESPGPNSQLSSLIWLRESESESHCDWRSVSLSVLVSSPCLTVTVFSLGGLPLWREDGSVVCQSVSSQLPVCTIFTFYMCHMLLNTYTTYTRPLSVRAQYSRLCAISGMIWLKVKVTLRLTVSQSVCLCIEPHLGLMTRYLLVFDSNGLVFVGRPL
jgi:hypothetical protein